MWTVKTKYDEMKVAIVEPGGMERYWALPIWGNYPLAWNDAGIYAQFNRTSLERQRRDMRCRQFKAVKDELPNVKLLYYRDLLQETLDEYREDKARLKKITATCFAWDWPRIEKWLGNRWMDLDADAILGRDCPILKDGSGYKIGIRPLPWLNNISEEGWMTSEGLIYNNKRDWWRSREDEVTRAIFENHPLLTKNVKVILDLSETEGCYVEGGDMTAPSEDSLVIGIGWHSNREACKEISKALPDKTIYAPIKIPDSFKHEPETFMWHMTWHLDGMFAVLDEGKALCAPYIFDHPKGGRKFLIKLLSTMRKDLLEWHPILRSYKEAGKKPPEELKRRAIGELTDKRIATIADMGGVEIYKKGKRVAAKDSFIDALIEDGVLDSDGVVYSGGDPDYYPSEAEFVFSAFTWETAGTSCCVECLKPGVVLTYDSFPNTIKAMKEHGVRSVTYHAHYQERFGGPCQDCSFFPLWRE